jgi:hypothetical protein
MAGEWIKMRTNLWDDPRVSQLCDLTGASEAAIVGALYWLWSSADEHTEDGHMPGLSLAGIDRKTGIKGFGDGLVEIGWIEDSVGGITIKRFGEHNGTSAKRRCMEAQRKANDRKTSAFDADKEQTQDGQNPPNCGAREEKRREELKPTTPDGVVAGSGAARPACPHQEIIAKYHELLPMGTMVKVWTGTREKHLQARWREDPKRQSLEWWSRFFSYVSKSEFLTGRAAPARDRDPFVVSLDWLVSPQNFAKTVEGKYHQGVA